MDWIQKTGWDGLEQIGSKVIMFVLHSSIPPGRLQKDNNSDMSSDGLDWVQETGSDGLERIEKRSNMSILYSNTRPSFPGGLL
jgi:hypothetical protein